VDTLGLLVAVLVHPADEQDRDGAYDLLEKARPHVARVQHLWADQGYTGELVGWIERTFGWLGRYRRLSKDYAEHPDTTEAWIYLEGVPYPRSSGSMH
jgi:putative transposase